MIENKCGMHLSVNLRKAQNAGIQQYEKAINEITPDNYELQQIDSNDQES